MSDPRTPEERLADLEVKARYADAIVVDSLVVGGMDRSLKGFPAGFTIEQFDELMTDTKDAGFDLFSTTISNGTDKSVEEVYARSEFMPDYLEETYDYRQVMTVKDVRKNKALGKISFVQNFQALDHLGEDLSHIPRFAEDGVKVMSFSYNISNQYTGSGDTNSLKSGPKGLTPLGVKAVKAMNDAGIVVDCSHDSDQTCIDIAKYSNKPVIASHSNARTLMPIDRNISDEAIIAIANTGGVVGVNFLGGFLNKEGDASPEAIAKHVVYIGDLVGKDHVAVGVDYVHNYKEALHWVIRNPQKFPPSSGFAQETEMGLPQDIWGLVRVLEDDYNWNEDEIRGLLGENLLRVYEANWANRKIQ